MEEGELIRGPFYGLKVAHAHPGPQHMDHQTFWKLARYVFKQTDELAGFFTERQILERLRDLGVLSWHGVMAIPGIGPKRRGQIVLSAFHNGCFPRELLGSHAKH